MLKLTTKMIGIMLITILLSAVTSLSKGLSEEELREALPAMLSSSNAGTEFYLTFHPCWETAGANNALRLYISSAVATQVRVEIPAVDFQETRTTIPNDIIEFSLAPSQGQMYSKTDRQPPLEEQVWFGRAIIVTADQPIILYGVTRFQATSDGFLAIPTSALGREYIVASWGDPVNQAEEQRIQWLTSYTSIVGIYDNTRVQFTLGGISNMTTPGGMIQGRPYTETLNAGDVWLIPAKGPSADLSGSKVRANNPVAVISGSFCAYIPEQIAACDFIIEQELPAHTWGTKYHLSPINKRTKNSWIKVFPKQRNTTIFRNGLEWALIPNSGGLVHDGYIKRRAAEGENRPFSFSGDGPFTITQFNPGQVDDNVESDPFQMVLTPIEQYQKEIIFNTPGINGGAKFDVDYINIVYKSTEDGGIPDHIEFAKVENGQFVPERLNIISGFPGQAFADQEISDGRYYYSKTYELPDQGVYKLMADEPFAAYAYGFGWFDSYGFPTSVALADLEKPDTIPPMPTYTMDCFGNVPSQDPLINPNNLPARVTDMPDDADYRSNLGMIIMIRNLSYNYTFDHVDFVPGNDRSTTWSLQVQNLRENARAVIRFSDRAGNDTLLTVEYFTTDLRMTPTFVDYGLHKIGGEPQTETFTLTNASEESPVTISRLVLKSIEENFDDSNFDLDFGNLQMGRILQPGEAVTFNVTFNPVAEGTYQDSIGVGDDCLFYYHARVLAKVGSPYITVTDIDFPATTVGQQAQPRSFTVSNPGTVSLSLFGYEGPQLAVYRSQELENVTMSVDEPFLIEPGESIDFQVNFIPDAVQDYPDEIVFDSDADDNYANHDPVCLITGRGIQPQLTVTGDDWGRVRADLVRYDQVAEVDRPTHYPSPNGAIVLSNPGSQDVALTAVTVAEQLNGDKFFAMVGGQYRSLNDQATLQNIFTNMIVSKADDNGNPGTEVVPVYFLPTERGDHRLVLNFASTSGVDEQSELQGIGIYPEATTIDLDFNTVDTPLIVGSDAMLMDAVFENLWEDDANSDVLTIYGLEFNDPTNLVTTDPNAVGGANNAVFFYDELQFPITLNRNNLEDVLSFPVTFDPGRDGYFEVSVTTISDAASEVTSTWRAYSDVENVATQGSATQICINNIDNLTAQVTNTGSSALEVTDIILRNTDGTAYNGGEFTVIGFDPNNATIETDATYTANIEYNPNATGTVRVNVVFLTNATSENLREITVGIEGTAVEFDRVTRAEINGNLEESVKPGQANLLYEVFVNAGELATEAFVNELTLQITYNKEFLAGGIYNAAGDVDAGVIRLGNELIARQFQVTDLSATLNRDTKEETITITMRGTIGLQDLGGQFKVLELDFTPFLPWYRNEDGEFAKRIRETTIEHVLTSGDECLVFATAQQPTVILEPVCVDDLRPISISATDWNLGNIFPNPVGSGGADISFSVGLNTDINIRIYNAQGEMVAEPINERMSVGEYSVTIPIEELSSGVYFYEMTGGPFKEMKKLVIQK